jgi:hypothetical protein
VTPSIAARLNRLPITRIHRTIVIIAGIGTFFDLFDIFLAGVLATVLTEHFHLRRIVRIKAVPPDRVYGRSLSDRASLSPTDSVPLFCVALIISSV